MLEDMKSLNTLNIDIGRNVDGGEDGRGAGNKSGEDDEYGVSGDGGGGGGGGHL
ncbi:unnamed protein product [Spirodela intermedia]|uniref:Uncharacterized protein n=1 Tax=Spirodela intermedia TaxID=51605 RepID=A0ABN7E7W9_SPIIN|nr:unnamed protein product [Spirodela intermedia]